MSGAAVDTKNMDAASPSADKKASQDIQSGPSKSPTSTPRTRRDRKKVEFFIPDPIGHDPEKLVVKEGKGAKLGEIPNVAFHLSKTVGRDELLEDLHSFLFGRKGKAQIRKKAISEFSGFAHDDDSEKQKEKDAGKLGRWKVDYLNRLLDLLDLPRGSGQEGSKDSKVERLIAFLDKPKQMSDKDLAAKAADKKAAAARRRERAQKAKEGSSNKRKGTAQSARSAKKAKKNGAAEEEEEEEAEDDDAEEQAGAADEEEEEEESAPKKKRASKGGSTSKKAPMEEEEEPGDMDTDFGGGLTKAVLREEVVEILRGANMDEFNLKCLMKQLEEKHKRDFGEQKPFIKMVAITFCAEQGPPQEPSKAAATLTETKAEAAEVPIAALEADAAAAPPAESAGNAAETSLHTSIKEIATARPHETSGKTADGSPADAPPPNPPEVAKDAAAAEAVKPSTSANAN